MEQELYRQTRSGPPAWGQAAEPEQARRLDPARIATLAGAATSVALILGLGVWGYELAVRDVRGVPVVRALDGPARVAPEEPGGEFARHTGLAVNAVAAEGTAAAPAEAIALAPAPAELAPDAVPMGELAEAALAPAPPVGETGLPLAATGPAPVEVLPAPLTTPAALDPAAAFAGAPPATAPEAPLEEDAVTASIDVLPEVPESVPGIARSPRPPVRPAGLGTRVAALTVADPAPAVVLTDAAPDLDPVAAAVAAAVAEAIAAPGPAEELDPATLPPGTRLVQLGAFDDMATARAEWDAVETRFGPLMAGKDRVIEPAESGGRTFYRLRVAGFTDTADARRFCAALLAEGSACIPAQVR